MTRIALILSAALVFAVPAFASSNNVTITIRHQVQHCHTWSVNNGPWRAAQTVTIAKGAAITFVDNDMMPHTLVQLGGPRLTFAPARMGKVGASTKVSFAKAGTYLLRTKPGEDYMPMKTTGEDNVLTLKVIVR